MSAPATWPLVHVVAAALFRDHPHHGLQLFVARRGPGRRHAGCWELPGGQVEPGEDEPTAIQREIREELSVEITLGARLGETTVPADGIRVRMAAWMGHIVQGEVALVDHDHGRWVGPDDLADLHWAPADVPLLGVLKAVWAMPRVDRPSEPH